MGFQHHSRTCSRTCLLSAIENPEVVDRYLEKEVWQGRERLAKCDIESAYRIVPVHPDDRQLLGMEWRGRLFVDAALLFALRSAPNIFSALADVMG